MAEEIVNEALVEESPLAESPLTETSLEAPKEESVSIETTSPPDDDKAKRMKAVYKMLDSDAVYYKYVPKTYDEFAKKFSSDVDYAKGIHKMIVSDEVYSKYLPETFDETSKYFGLGKPSAVPSASVGGGSAMKGRGVEQPSMSPQLSSEASLDNIQQTIKVLSDKKGMFPENLSAADIKELRKQLPDGLIDGSDDEVAKKIAGKTSKQVTIESINAIPDEKERKTETARMYLDWAKEKGSENRQLDQNITILKQGLAQIKSEGENLQQQLQNPNIDPQTASMLNESLQQTQANYNQSVNDYNNELNKYQQNARFIKTMLASSESNLEGGYRPSMFLMPQGASDVFTASAWNATVPSLLKTLGAVVDIWPSMVYGEDTEDSNSPVADAIFKLADMATIDIGKYSPKADVSLMDDVNAENISKLFGSLLGSISMTFGGGAVAGATGAQIAGFSQVYGDVYKQGRDAGLTQAESMYFALPTGIVAAYLGDKGVESLAGAFTKTSIKSAIKQGVKEMAEKKTPQMMMELGQKVITNTIKGGVKEGLQEGSEFVTEFGSKKGASLKEGVKFQDDLSLKGFEKGLKESVVTGAVGGGLLGPFLGAGRNQAFSDVVNKAARDPQAEIDFMEKVDASVAANDITLEQKQQIVDMLEKTKQAAVTVPPVVESEPARTEATALVLEQQDLQQQIEQTNPAMAKPLNDRLDEVNNRLGEIAEGKNLPTEQPTPQAPASEEVKAEAAPITEQAVVAETPTTETQKEEAAPVAEEAKPQEKGEFSIQGTFDGMKQVLGDPDNLIPDIVRADIEPKFSESNQNGKKIFTLTVPQLDDSGRAGYLAVSLVLPETTTKTIDDVKSALQEKVAEAQAAVELSREKGFPLETVFKNKVGSEYVEQVAPTTEAQAPVAEEAKGESGVEENKYTEAKGDDVQDIQLKGKEYQSETMSPDEYLEETGGYASTFIDQKKVDKIKEKIKNGTPLDPLTLTSKEGSNVGQEGRHRAEAAKQLGIKEIPVVRIEGELPNAKSTPTSEQAPQSFPAQEGATAAQEQEFKANPELEQIYRDLNAAVTKNVDKDTIRMLKENPTEAMVDKALRELQKKRIIEIDCN